MVDATLSSVDIDISVRFEIADFMFDIFYLFPGTSVRYSDLKLCVLSENQLGLSIYLIYLVATHFFLPLLVKLIYLHPIPVPRINSRTENLLYVPGIIVDLQMSL